jgi:hypothetical protein
MKTSKIILFFVAFLLFTSCFILWRIERPKQLLQRFVGHLSNERYNEAAQMLADPCMISVAPDGGLTIVDHRGIKLVVPKARLPFLAGGGKPDHPSRFSMTALQGSVNGNIPPPVVTIYLSIKGGEVVIDELCNRSQTLAVPLEDLTTGNN